MCLAIHIIFILFKFLGRSIPKEYEDFEGLKDHCDPTNDDCGIFEKCDFVSKTCEVDIKNIALALAAAIGVISFGCFCCCICLPCCCLYECLQAICCR